ncbi:MAG: hypothetical protein A3K19_33825 [Lentisphaerae bacterium RIFOXYB12_FULL_65_16]|nr:MAG: hypothetical protein A3K19_22280 [Lentisphaerae bacterium RIFOXYB12_FULL_65_16]OGV95246.1 MAG: hypothetical protein A3K19_33825 [Lentisphaerae bacterium RIFOXYB12_FULL_65_16]
MCHIERALGFFEGLLRNTQPNRPRMLQLAREGFAATPDLAVKLIRDKGYGGRCAHRICATFVRLARERDLKACDTTGELLDDAARLTRDLAPGLATADVRDALDPVAFLARHTNIGDPAPAESQRLIAARRAALATRVGRQADRQAKLTTADTRLRTEIDAILGG